MIELREINKKFNDQLVLENFNLKIAKEEFVAITGRSGAGKSTILNIIGFVTKPDSGDIIINNLKNPNGKQIMDLRRNHLGYIFQNFLLMENETVNENLKVSKKFNRKYNDEEVLNVLDEVGLNHDYLKKKIYQLSGGEQQRVAIARCMLKSYDVVLADEPTGNLDHENKLIIINLFKRFKELGKTVVCVTHDSDVAKAADRIIEI